MREVSFADIAEGVNVISDLIGYYSDPMMDPQREKNKKIVLEETVKK